MLTVLETAERKTENFYLQNMRRYMLVKSL